MSALKKTGGLTPRGSTPRTRGQTNPENKGNISSNKSSASARKGMPATRGGSAGRRKAGNNSSHLPLSFADLDYDDKLKTIAKRTKGGKETIILGQYQLVKKVGKGAFGVVYKALQFETQQYVAIKRLSKDQIDAQSLLNLKSEIDLLKRLDHPNIVKYVSLVESDHHINLVLEFIESGSLLSIIKQYGEMPESLAAVYIGQVLRGLSYLHRQKVIHRDIKASNILITANGIIKLADFCIAATGDREMEDTSSFFEGSPFWLAPEVIQLAKPDPSGDIWSLGCTVIELLTGNPPYFDMPAMSALFRIVQDDHLPLPDGISPELKDFLTQCFKKDVSQRPTADKLLAHPWVKNASASAALGTSVSPGGSPGSLSHKTPSEPVPGSARARREKGHHKKSSRDHTHTPKELDEESLSTSSENSGIEKLMINLEDVKATLRQRNVNHHSTSSSSSGSSLSSGVNSRIGLHQIDWNLAAGTSPTPSTPVMRSSKSKGTHHGGHKISASAPQTPAMSRTGGTRKSRRQNSSDDARGISTDTDHSSDETNTSSSGGTFGRTALGGSEPSSSRDRTGSDGSEDASSGNGSWPRQSPRITPPMGKSDDMPQYVVLITGFETRKNKLFTYTVFKVKVSYGSGGESWTVWKTYTDFKEFHKKIRAKLSKNKAASRKLPTFPPTRILGADKASFAKKRKVKLQKYLEDLLKVSEVVKTGLVTNFLKEDGEDALSRDSGGFVSGVGAESADEGNTSRSRTARAPSSPRESLGEAKEHKAD